MQKKIYLTIAILILFKIVSYAQPKEDDYKDMGVAVSPSSMHLSIKPGSIVTKEIKVNNATSKTNKFQIGFSDFEMGPNGKPINMRKSNGRYSLSKWITASPTYFELKPGEIMNIKLTFDIPDTDSSYISAWTILTIDQVVDRAPLDATDKPGAMSMGIIPSMGFGVYVYQNPPNVKTKNVEIQKFILNDKDGKKKIAFEVKNTGDGIGYCSSYVELTNTKTGKQDRLQVKQFTILPQFSRIFDYDLPTDLAKGKYSVVGVIDFGSKEEIIAAELEFEIP